MLIVDGYNILMQTPQLKGKKLEEARQGLIEALNRRHRLYNGITLVFDGKEEVFPPPHPHPSKIKVVYARGQSADDCIKTMVRKSKNPAAVVVATDDREVRDFSRIQGARHLPAQQLVQMLFPTPGEKEVLPEKKIDARSSKGKAITEQLKKEWGVEE